MIPTDYTDFPSDPSELGHMLASDCVGRESNIIDLANDWHDAGIESYLNAKNAARDAARAPERARLWAEAIARELGRTADEAGTARLAADLNGGAK
jgi:hypothetical protein